MKQKIFLLVLLSLFVLPMCRINGLTNNNSNELSPDAMVASEKWLKETGYIAQSSPCVADLDNDGFREIILSATDSKLYCLDYLGNEKWSYTMGGESTYESSPIVADVDNDGLLEILIGADDSKLYCINSTGDLVWDFTAIMWVHTPTVADLDKNGDLEILFTTVWGNCYCLFSNGTLFWVHAGTERCNPVVCDIDQDGILDVLITKSMYTVCLDYQGNFKWEGDSSAGEFLCVGDINNNGDIEVITTSLNRVDCHNSTGGLVWGITYTYGTIKPPLIADLYNNGSKEILFTHNNDRICCLSSKGYTIWNISCDSADSLAIVDLDSNGELEIVVGTYDSLKCFNYQGSIQWQHSFTSPYYNLGHIAIADLENDGTLDIVFSISASTPNPDGLVCVKIDTILPNNKNQWYCERGSVFRSGQTDRDGDYIDDNTEIYYQTNSSNSDTDLDGLEDGYEVLYIHTNPATNDSDADNLPDNWEVNSGTNPLLDDAGDDPDEDNLTNFEEYNFGTNPILDDTDGDNTPDGWEIANSFDPLVQDSDEDPDTDDLDNYNEYLQNTDPHIADTDADGLFDGAEVNTYGTNPLLNDTDGDGYLDGEEVAAGSDPLDKFSIPNSGLDGFPKWGIGVIVVVILFVLVISFYLIQRQRKISLDRKITPDVLEEPKPAKKILEKTCFVCGQPLGEGDKNCSSCKSDVFKCNTCKLPIQFGESIAVCSKCGSIGHQSHIQEHVKVNAKCPSCLQELSLSELRIIEEPNILTKKDEPEDKIVFDEPKLKDEKHAAIVEYLTRYVSKTSEELSKVTEYSFRSSKGFIDLITYAVKDNIMDIKIYEVKSTIYDVGDTIRQIKRYANYVAGTKDKIFGAMKEKRIQTYLVLIDSKRNNKIFDDHFSTFLNSGIDYVIFINTLKEKVNILALTKLSSSNL